MKKNNPESILSKLLKTDFRNWPSLWKNLQEDEMNISSTKEEQILFLIRKSEEKYILEKPKKKIFQFKLSFVFSTFIVLFLFYLYSLTGKKTFQVLSTNGDVQIIRNNEKKILETNTELKEGDELITSISQKVIFSVKQENENLIYFILKENSALKITKLDLKNYHFIFEGLNSNLVFFSEKQIEKNLSLVSGNTVFKLLNTKANIITSPLVSKVKLKEGKIKIFSQNLSIEIDSNHEISLKQNEIPKLENILPLEEKSIEEMFLDLSELKKFDKKIVQSLETEFYQKEDTKIYENLDSIKKEYGSLNEIVLKNGSRIKGHLIMEDDHFKIITLDKKIKINKEEIFEINDLE